MNKILPIVYGEYGRYITRFRAIPYYIDCLKPIERRLLLSLYDVARNSLTKSAKVIGWTIGNYSPHGDSSSYESLVNLANGGYCIKKGNWGSPGLNDANAASMRYTEIKLAPWVLKFGFEYHQDVPWEALELDPEPLYLPSPIPLGLIGEGITEGVAFHKTVVPKYTAHDLLDRAIWLITKKVMNYETNELLYPENDNGPIIKPYSSDCRTKEETLDIDYLKLLTEGTGKIKYIPNIDITKKKELIIKGRAPGSRFNTLKRHIVEKKLPIDTPNDLSKDKIEILIRVKRGTDFDEFVKSFIVKYLVKQISFNIIVTDEEGQAFTVGVDQILQAGYDYWKNAIIVNTAKKLTKLNDKYFEFSILPIIKNIIETFKVTSIKQIVQHFNSETKINKILIVEYDLENDKWSNIEKEITEKDIVEVCKNRSIQQLIEYKDQTLAIKKEIEDLVNIINDIDTYALTKLKTFKNVKI